VAPSARVALFKGIGAVMEALPERFGVGLASSIAGVFGRRQKGARANLRGNIARALAPTDGAVGDDLLELFVDRAFHSYGQYWAESAKLPAMSKSAIDERFTIAEGLEHLYEGRDRKRGTIIALPHVGSWEWGGAFLDSLGLGMTAVAEVLEPPALFDWFKAKREAIGIRVAPLDEHAGSTLLAALRDGGVVGLLCDRDIQGNGVEVEFFGERVALPPGPATLALRTGAMLVAAACYIGPGRDHFAVVSAPIAAERRGRLRDDVTRVTQAVASELEVLIRRAPEQWHVLEARFATP